MSTLEVYTVAEIAAEMGVTDARVRQLCMEYKIGTIKGNIRLLTRSDVKKLKSIPRRPYEKSSENS